MAKISILIAIYNGIESIPISVGCLQRQTLKDIEIVCVNDNSTDASLELLEEMKSKDDRIRIVNFKENRGTVCARKAGVEAANGEYIMFMDQDDQFEEFACEELYAMISEKKVDIINFRSRVIAIPPTTEKQRQWQEDFMNPYDGFLYDEDVFDYCFRPNKNEEKTWNYYTWNVWNKIYKTEICKKAMEECSEEYVVNGDDMYVYMLISYYAKSYYGDRQGKFYHIYSYGSGLMGSHKLNVKRFYTLIRRMTSIRNIEKFFFKIDKDYYKEVVELDFARALCGIVQRWYSRIEESDQGNSFDMMLEYLEPYEIMAGLHKHVKVGFDKMLKAVESAEKIKCTKVYIKTVAVYFTENQNSPRSIDIECIKVWRKKGYKIIFITEENTNIEGIVGKDEKILRLPNEINTEFYKYPLMDRMKKLSAILQDYHIDAYVYSGKKNNKLIYDMLLVKTSGVAFIIDASEYQLFINAKTRDEAGFSGYKKLLLNCDAVMYPKNTIEDYFTKSILSSFIEYHELFEKVCNKYNYPKVIIDKMIMDKEFLKTSKKLAIKEKIKNENAKGKIKVRVKQFLNLFGGKYQLNTDEYDYYKILKGNNK